MSNKYLEKIAAGYFYDQTGHFADHAEDMRKARSGDLLGATFTGKNRFDYKGSKYDEVWKRRTRGITAKGGGAKTLLGAAIGGALGGFKGYSEKRDDLGKRLSKSDRIWNATTDGLTGALAGGYLGAAAHGIRVSKISNRGFKGKNKLFDIRHKTYADNSNKFSDEVFGAWKSSNKSHNENFHQKQKQWYEEAKREQQRQHQRQSSGGGRSYGSAGGSVSDLHRDLEFPEGGFKTKAEATKHYRKMSMKHHPDRGGDPEKMKKINTAWDKFKAHPDGFEKLAHLHFDNVFLDSIYEQVLA